MKGQTTVIDYRQQEIIRGGDERAEKFQAYLE
jgi:hypothetical protein